MSTWQHNFDFRGGRHGWSQDLGSHGPSGLLAGEAQTSTHHFRGLRFSYQFSELKRITKIVLDYDYQVKNGDNQIDVDSQAFNGGIGQWSEQNYIEGEILQFTASGLWSVWEGSSFGPDGRLPVPDPNGDTIDTTLNDFSLIGRFGTPETNDWSDWFQIGSQLTMTVPKTGKLYMICNDTFGEGAFEDNNGSISVFIERLSAKHHIRFFQGSTQTAEYISILGKPTVWTGDLFASTISIEIFCAIDDEELIGNNSFLKLKTLQLFGNGLNPFVVVEQPPTTHDGGNQCPFNFNAFGSETSGSPISIRNGEKREEVTDLSIHSPSGGLNFTRAYRQTMLGQYESMGLGWTHNHNMTIDNSVTGKLLVQLGNGGKAHFTQVDSTDVYNGDPGSVSVIEAGGSGNQVYTLTASDKSKYFFAGNGKLTSRELANGETLTYTYYTSGYTTGLLQKVTDDYGRKLQFVYIDNSSGFDHLQLWRVGDTDATGLGISTPTGRYVEFGYIPEKLNGTTISSPKALLHTIRDVRGNTWTYDYYGAEIGESDTAKANFLVRYFSPSVDMTGDGNADGSIAIKNLIYTLSGNTIANITQKLGGVSGSYLLTTDYAFQPDAENITEEITAGKKITHYFADGVYAGTEDANNNSNFSGVNSQYRPTGMQDANGNVTQMAWSEDGKHLEGVTDAVGNEIAFTYNTDDTLNDSTDAIGRKTEYTYGDSSNPRQPTKIVLKEGTTVLKHQEFTYDANGRVLEERVIDPTGGATLLQKVTRTYYTTNGLLESIIQYERTSSGSFIEDDSTTYTYDGAGRVIKTAKSSLFGNCQFTYTLYDHAGNVLATACGRENVTPPTTVEGMIDLYDDADDVKKHTRVTVHEYDALGRRYKTISNAGMTTQQVTLNVQDALNRVVRTIANYKENSLIPHPFTAPHSDFDNVHGSAKNENLVTDVAYNARGMVRKQTDSSGNITLYGYDDAGRVIKTVQSANTPNYNNDYVGASPDPDLSGYSPTSNSDKDLITTNTYDKAGNLVMTVDVLGNKHFTVYDWLNRPIKTVRNAKTDAKVVYEVGDMDYLAENDPRSEDYVPSSDSDKDLITTNTYDKVGNLVMTVDVFENRPTPTWETTLYGYDGLGRQVKVIRNASSPTYDLTTDPDLSDYETSGDADKDIISTTTYDGDGRVLYPEDMNGNKTYMVYDNLGRQVKRILNYIEQGSSLPLNWIWDVNRWEDGASSPIFNGTNADENIISETHHDDNGRVTWTRDMLGRRNYTVYDDAGRVIRQVTNYDPQGLTNVDPASWIWNANAGHWEDGATISVNRGTNDDFNIITDMIYDGQGRVYQTIDTWIVTPTSTWYFDNGKDFDDGLNFS